MKTISAFLWLMWRIAWESFRHPFTTSAIEIRRDSEDQDE